MEFFGINPGEALVLLVVAALVLGPQQVVSGIRRLQSLRATITRFSAAARDRFTAETNGPLAEVANLGKDIVATVPTNNQDLAELTNPQAYIRAQVAEEMNAWIRTLTTEANSELPTDKCSCPHCNQNQSH